MTKEERKRAGEISSEIQQHLQDAESLVSTITMPTYWRSESEDALIAALSDASRDANNICYLAYARKIVDLRKPLYGRSLSRDILSIAESILALRVCAKYRRRFYYYLAIFRVLIEMAERARELEDLIGVPVAFDYAARWATLARVFRS